MFGTTRKISNGELVANALRHSWRVSANNLDSGQADFDTVTPLLYDSGAAGLGWWRIRYHELSSTPSGELLHQAFRLLTLQAAIHENKIARVVRAFRAGKVEPVLIKGWAMARLYPERALRPYGDIDLLVRPRDKRIAYKIVASEQLRDCQIDLHAGAFEVADRSVEDLYARSQLVVCKDEQLLVLGEEDHLALIAVHLLKHAAWRPLWLCDLALLVETASPKFDWNVCLGSDSRRANWILSAIGLAHALLDANIADAQIALRAAAPSWLIQAVLKNWAQPFAGKHEPNNHLAEMRSYARRPRGLLRDLKRRWPDPILATVSVNGSFGSRRRLRYQLRNCLERTARLVHCATQTAS
ncbi:MAG TPA: nucleotidyltransferase family protein [Pyrinomonadaceae bacterium]|jgi:hypothetical protein|nr:nucleotidyltransferase family protein [Pyrinomonadaceae bacterium]